MRSKSISFFAVCISTSIFAAAAPAAAPGPAQDPASPDGYAAADWPQLQHDAQHTGRAPDTGLRMPAQPDGAAGRWTEFVVDWSHDFALLDPPQHISRVAQIIACGNRLFVPTMEGRLYALNPADGAILWTFDCGEGVMHTAGAAEDRVFFAGINGGVFALDAETGKQLWQWRPAQRDGFSAAVLLVEDKIFIGSRAGFMRALSQAEGKLLWETRAGGPIYQTAAYNAPSAHSESSGQAGSGQGGRVYAATEDMHAYCWSASDGKLLWKSDQLNGMSFRDYYPLVYRGKVFFESLGAWSGMNCVLPVFNAINGWFPLASIFEHEKEFDAWMAKHGEAMAEGKPDDEALRDIFEAQQQQIALFEQFPRENPRHVLDEETGRENVRLPWAMMAMCGNQPPPTLDRDDMLIMPVPFVNGRYGRFDWQRMQFVDMLMGVGQWDPNDLSYSLRGGTNHDEVHNVSTAGPLIFVVHASEKGHQFGGVGMPGVYCLETRRWGRLEGLPSYKRLPDAQCGGRAASIAYGAAYYQCYGFVRAWVPNTGK